MSSSIQGLSYKDKMIKSYEDKMIKPHVDGWPNVVNSGKCLIYGLSNELCTCDFC